MALEYSRVTEDEGEVAKIVMRTCLPPFRKGYLRVGPEKVFLTEYFLEFADAIKNLEIRDDDVWVVSHPKTGTTWTQEMVWCIANDLDFERAKQAVQERFPFIDHTPLMDLRDVLERDPDFPVPPFVLNSVKYVTDMKSPRFIKSHLPWSLLPQQLQDGTKKPKMIYVCRNAKDTCISYYHHCVLLEGFGGNFEDFCELFMGNSIVFNPFWSHVIGFWERRNLPNVLFLKYEELKKDLPAVIRRTSEFLGKPLTEDQVDTLTDHLSFESMKNNRAVNYDQVVEISQSLGYSNGEGTFMRSGTVGQEKGKMSSEMLQKFEAWTKENLQGTDLVL